MTRVSFFPKADFKPYVKFYNNSMCQKGLQPAQHFVKDIATENIRIEIPSTYTSKLVYNSGTQPLLVRKVEIEYYVLEIQTIVFQGS